jgi:lysophospholipase L1-like esterase
VGKYRTLGTLFNRVFRNDLNQNFEDIDKDIQAQKAYTDSEIAVQKKRVDDLIINTPQPSEVVDARGGHSVLRDRLDSVDAQLADIATKKADISYVYDSWAINGLNTFIQRQDLVFGREYLKPFLSKLGSGNNTNIVFSGDSTTAGYALEAPGLWSLDKAFKRLLGYDGFDNVTTINNGQSGMCTEHWNRTYVQNDLSANPDLLVLRWGINDPAYDNQLNHLADDGQNYSIRRNANDFYTSLDSGLSKIRAQRNVDSLTIVLMTPNSTSDDLSFRNEAWHESINSKIRYLARKYNCVFIDTFRLWQDSRNATSYMDVINQGHIHPLDMFNLWITDYIYQVCVPELFRKEYTNFHKWHNLSLENGWVNTGGEFDTAAYQKIDYNTVQLKGIIQGGTTTAFTEIATIPITYAPTKSRFFNIMASSGYATIKIMNTGSIQIVRVTAGDWIDLSSITYAI